VSEPIGPTVRVSCLETSQSVSRESRVVTNNGYIIRFLSCIYVSGRYYKLTDTISYLIYMNNNFINRNQIGQLISVEYL